MRFGHVVVLVLLVGCGKEIGDACAISSDCSPNGDRICVDPNTNGGYCTVAGCDYSTCPDEAVCVRFYTGSFENKACTQPTDCSLDELCAIEGHCVPRSSEVRFCMKKCSGNSDCRSNYECRTFELMQQHGGEPVLAPPLMVDETNAPKFCAAAPPPAP